MAGVDDKENVAPFASSDLLSQKMVSPGKKPSRKARSKSIGPGDIDTKSESAKHDARNRRKSAFVPASKSIISSEVEKKARQAARRQTLANRRVSFAPEATLHTWDVIEFMRDQTTSTDSSDQTRRCSNATPFGTSPADDEEPPSTPQQQEDEPRSLPASPAAQRDLHRKQTRRASGLPPAILDHPDDVYSSSVISGSSDASGSEEEDNDDEELLDDTEDATGTAMSLDELAEQTIRSLESGSSTSSSLTRRLKEASEMAGTRGIEYDEHGEGTMSMELAGEEITNAFKPWAQHATTTESVGSASLDQENVNPFSPAFKAQIASGVITRPATIIEEDTADMSMDVTRAIGGILQQGQPQKFDSSPLGDGTMDMTQAVGRITSNIGEKRRRSTTEAGSPGETASMQHLKRSRRSSVARSSMGDDTMDMTMAVGGILEQGPSPQKSRRHSAARRRSSAVMSEQEEATMDCTQTVGGIKAAPRAENTASSFDENEELTMELTTVLGGIKERAAVLPPSEPTTPRKPMSPPKNLSPKDHDHFKDAPDSGPKKLLTPLFMKQVHLSAEKPASSAERAKRRKTITPQKVSWLGPVFDETREPEQDAAAKYETVQEEVHRSPIREAIVRIELPNISLPAKNPSVRITPRTPPSQSVVFQQQLDAQLMPVQPSPSVEKVLRTTPAKQASTPERMPVEVESQEARSTLVNSIRLMSTPRKDTLKTVTPRKQPVARLMSPVKAVTPKAMTPRPRPVPARKSPMKRNTENVLQSHTDDRVVERVHLGDFLEEAGIRFMDLTATKRRMTIAPTPSKMRKTDAQDDDVTESSTALESATIAAVCTQPEHDMYQHACHELKHYISEGKKVIKQLGAETYEETPPLIQAYVNASPARRATLDAHMREMKTHARFRSKETWYQWRSQLLDDLMKGLSGIGEGLLRDDEVLQQTEQVLEDVLPGLVEGKESLVSEFTRLEEALSATSEQEKADLDAARERLVEVDGELGERRRLLAELRHEAEEQEAESVDLQESKTEFVAAIREAERVRESSRGVSLNEIATLKESITYLEETYGWKIASASSSPPTLTLTYMSQLQLFFHPAGFLVPTQSVSTARPNAPIRLSYIAQDPSTQQPREVGTTLRFFLQFLRASMQGLPQCETRVPELLGLVSGGWKTAQNIVEAEKRLNIETLATSRIVSDEKLAIEADILLPQVRTKVRVAFTLSASIEGKEGVGLVLQHDVGVKVVYGEAYNEAKMIKFVGERFQGAAEQWVEAVRELKQRLLASGAKGWMK
ncbi:hypothetical protein LTR62_006146 [Meristemomyces frigidus]|uniref:Spc7 kinetochore protein domain-containing protein n=1 Tax=Meristemomyces frigidus TaxID=1508187 RepID=A0AAN7TEV4_9PEZI|nr:hypothetical protein LTR62_006146 [Meristemomyces frigidus]